MKGRSLVLAVTLTLTLSACWETETPLMPAGISVSPVDDAPAFLWALSGDDASAVAEAPDVFFLAVRRPGEDVAFDFIDLEGDGRAVSRMAPYAWGEGDARTQGFVLEVVTTEERRGVSEQSTDYYWLQRGEHAWRRYGSGLKGEDPRRSPASYAALQAIIREEHASGSLDLYDHSVMYALSARTLDVMLKTFSRR